MSEVQDHLAASGRRDCQPVPVLPSLSSGGFSLAIRHDSFCRALRTVTWLTSRIVQYPGAATHDTVDVGDDILAVLRPDMDPPVAVTVPADRHHDVVKRTGHGLGKGRFLAFGPGCGTLHPRQ